MAKARMIDYSNRQRSVKIPAEIKPLAKLLLQHIAEHFQIPCGVKLSFILTNKDTIRQLNRDYRGFDKVTDVLSFPLQEYRQGCLDYDSLTDAEFEKGKLLLGDVVICAPIAKAQAEEFGHSLERELLYLFVHSVLHLLGFDHEQEEEKAQMRLLEEAFLKEAGCPA